MAVFCISALRQDETGELKSAYSKLTGGDKQAAAKTFADIAAANANDWAANYYAVYAICIASQNIADQKQRDAYLDKAGPYLAKVKALNQHMDETLVLVAFADFSRFLVDPGNRWKQYLPVINDNLEKAKAVNPNNPRVYYLEGVPVFNKPRVWGGGKSKAKPYFEKAAVLFAAQDTTSIRKPFWGAAENADYLKRCAE